MSTGSSMFTPPISTPADSFDTSSRNTETWSDDSPWGQYLGGADRRQTPPLHSPDGGAGNGDPDDATVLGSILDPVLNWKYTNDAIGTTSLSTAIGDFSNSINSPDEYSESCGGDSLFPVIIQEQDIAGTAHSFLRIIEGEDADLAWTVDLGPTRPMKVGPIVADMNDDGQPEILVMFDSQGTMNVEMWSPSLTCTPTGWSSGGSHASDQLWTWTDEGLSLEHPIGANAGWPSDHHPTAQPVVADLDLDGNPEVAIAAISEVTETPVILSLSLPMTGSAEENWRAEIQEGSHPSDLAYAQLSENTASVFLTSIEENDGLMWAWRLDGATGASEWSGGASLGNLDGGGSNAPQIRLPGPIVAQLDADDTPELILTIPTDAGGNGPVDGAEFIGIEATNAAEIWSFSAYDGYADAPPVTYDSDDDGVDDRVCWITWRSNTGSRDGLTGCTNVESTPVERWRRTLESSSGTLNDEIAVAPPFWMDIDGEGEPELMVPYGRSLHAFDGESGTSAAVSVNWSNEFELETRTWAAAALADIDGDAIIDILIGDLVISHGAADVRPFLDGGGIEFDPPEPDPGETTTVTAFVENAGTVVTDGPVDVVLYADGLEIGRDRIQSLEPANPSGTGTFDRISVDWAGDLGNHTFSMIIDPLGNLTETRIDNNQQNRTLEVMEPFAASVGIQGGLVRVDPGASKDVTLTITNTGKNTSTWSIEIDSANLPENWTAVPLDTMTSVELDSGEEWNPRLRISAPSSALGSDSGIVNLRLTIAEDASVEIFSAVPVEANRTRGISLRGPMETSSTTGWGIPGGIAHSWILIENLGNAVETTTGLTFGSTGWGNGMMLKDPEQSWTSISSLTLQPGEIKHLSLAIDVPSNANPGESETSDFEICIGSGELRECETIQVIFIASKIAARPSHDRVQPIESGPETEWVIEGILNPGDEEMEWDLYAAGLASQSGWILSGSGDLSVESNRLYARSLNGSFTGSLFVDLPPTASPLIHTFSIQEANDTVADLNLSLNVLQVHRATISNPSDPSGLFNGKTYIETNTPSDTILSFQNHGNGMDEYQIIGTVDTNGNLSNSENITIQFPVNTLTLQPGVSTSIPATITVPTGTPARIPFTVYFEMISLGDTSVIGTAQILYEVQQDHAWNYTSPDTSMPLYTEETDLRIIALPGETLSIPVMIENIGNYDDQINLSGEGTLQTVSGDPASSWTIQGASSLILDVGENDTLLLNVSIPEDAWNGSIMTIDWTVIAGEIQTLEGPSHRIEVGHAPSWSIIATGIDLDIAPEGEIIELSVVQDGNLPAEPYANTFVKGVLGWNVSVLEMPGILSPGESGLMRLNITPPEITIAGAAVELNIILRNADGSGTSTMTLPIRVDAVHDHILDGEADWIITPDGGMPLLWIRNLGNAPTTIEIDVQGVGDGWSVNHPQNIHLAIGEVRGIPIDLTPPNETGTMPTITVITTDQGGNQQEFALDPVISTRSWATTPVIVGMESDLWTMSFHGSLESETVRIEASGPLENSNSGWLYTIGTSGSISATISGESLNGMVFSTQPSERSAICSSDLNGTFVQSICTIVNGTGAFGYTMLVIDDSGTLLASNSGEIPAGEGSMIHLNSTWEPTVGHHSITVILRDAQGRLIFEDVEDYIIRNNDWNIGISSFTSSGVGSSQTLRITTTRTIEIPDAVCSITYTTSTGSWSLIQTIDMGGLLNPSVEIERPEIQDGEQITAKLACASPWDIDSTPSDDEKSITLTDGQGAIEASSDTIFAATTAAIVLAALWFIGFVRPDVAPARKPQKRSNQDQSKVKKGLIEKSPKKEIEEESDDSIQLEGSDEDEETIPSNDTPEIEIEDIEEIVELSTKEPTELERRLEGVTDPFERKIIELEFRKEQRASRRR